jgi:hypothetical protein
MLWVLGKTSEIAIQMRLAGVPAMKVVETSGVMHIDRREEED